MKFVKLQIWIVKIWYLSFKWQRQLCLSCFISMKETFILMITIIFFTNLLYSQILNIDFYRLCLEISLTSFCLMMYILDLMVEFVVSGVSALVRDSVLCSVVGALCQFCIRINIFWYISILLNSHRNKLIFNNSTLKIDLYEFLYSGL